MQRILGRDTLKRFWLIFTLVGNGRPFFRAKTPTEYDVKGQMVQLNPLKLRNKETIKLIKIAVNNCDGLMNTVPVFKDLKGTYWFKHHLV